MTKDIYIYNDFFVSLLCNLVIFWTQVYSNTTLVKDNYGSPALARATGGERVGVEHCSDGKTLPIFFL